MNSVYVLLFYSGSTENRDFDVVSKEVKTILEKSPHA